MKHSVDGYNIYDSNHAILYDKDIVRVVWGGGNERGKRYRTVCYHCLSISKYGKLKISGCSNIVYPSRLLKIQLTDSHELNTFFKEYY